jgi:hypothetical protein
LKSEDAKGTLSGDLSGLFAALSLIAIDHAGAAERGGEPEQASKDAVRDAVFANAGAVLHPSSLPTGGAARGVRP